MKISLHSSKQKLMSGDESRLKSSDLLTNSDKLTVIFAHIMRERFAD